jgi:HTH-type transcriptional regulator / antitoxin HigA
MQIRPIRTEADHQAALAEVERLWAAEPGSRELDRLDVLATLIEAYEARHFPIDPPDPIDAVLFRLDQRGLSRKDLEPYIGSRARVSEILGGKRSLTLAMIRRLHEGLGIPAEVLIRPRERRPASASRRSAASRLAPERSPARRRRQG